MFWLLLILALVPSNIDANYSIYNITSNTFEDLGGFCDRNPSTCDQSKEMVYHIKEKAVYAGGLVMSFLGKAYEKTATLSHNKEAVSEDLQNPNVVRRSFATYETPQADTETRNINQDPSQNTLKTDDLEVEWLAPENGVGI